MPLPKLNKGEKTKAFLNRCMDNDVMNSEYPDTKQRYAICVSQAERAGRKVAKSKGSK